MDIRSIVQSVNIFQATHEGNIKISEMNRVCPSSRPTIQRRLADAVDSSLVQEVDDCYKLTAAGDLILREFEKRDPKIQNNLYRLCDSERNPEILQAVKAEPVDKANIKNKTGISRATVHRRLNDLHNLGLINAPNGNVTIEALGGEVLKEYNDLKEVIGIIEEKIKFLERFEYAKMDVKIPLEALAASREVVSTMKDSQKVVREIANIDGDEAEPQRALSPAFSEQISDSITTRAPVDVDGELIVDRSVYRIATNPKHWKYLFAGIKQPNWRVLIYPGDVTVGAAYWGSEEAVVSAYNDEHPLHVGLFGNDDALIEWATEIYDHYRAQAVPPRSDLINWVAAQ